MRLQNVYIWNELKPEQTVNWTVFRLHFHVHALVSCFRFISSPVSYSIAISIGVSVHPVRQLVRKLSQNNEPYILEVDLLRREWAPDKRTPPSPTRFHHRAFVFTCDIRNEYFLLLSRVHVPHHLMKLWFVIIDVITGWRSKRSWDTKCVGSLWTQKIKSSRKKVRAEVKLIRKIHTIPAMECAKV